MRPLAMPRRAAGFSLIELLVSMAIGLIVTISITATLLRSEGGKRSTTSVNDLNQTGNYLAYVMDRAIRSAGSGFSQSWGTTYGCLLNATTGGTQVLPQPAFTTGSPFGSFAMPLRLAPVVIGKSLANVGGIKGGDVLMVMSGTAGAAEVPMQVSPNTVSTQQFQVANNLVYRQDNVVLLVDPNVPGGCLMEQVAAPTTANVVPFNTSGAFYSTSGSTVNLAQFASSSTAMAAQLGVAGTNPPQFQLFGVGANNALFSYDLLQPAANNESQIADGVVEMRAIYGISGSATVTPVSTPTNVVTSWVDPTANTGYEPAVLLNGSANSQTNLRSIVAVRLGFFMRTSLQERPGDYQLPANTKLTLFADAVNGAGTSIAQTRTLTGTDLFYRWRTVEVTIPLINVQNAN